MNKYLFKTTSTTSSRTINEVVKSGVRVTNPRKGGGNLTFSVSARDRDRVCSTLTSFERVYEKTDLRLLPRLLWRFGIYIALILGIVTSIILSNYLFSIDVSGTNRIDRTDVLEYLEDVGIGVGSIKAKVDEDKIEAILMEKFPFSVVDCRVVGMSLVINVKEELQSPNFVDLVDKRPIVAKEDAVITRIVTLSGTTVVTQGKSVKKGDILIDCKRLVGDVQLECRAIGEIHGKVWRKKEVFIPSTVMVKERTGVSKTLNYLSFGKVTGGVQSPYPYYEKEEYSVATTLLPFFKHFVTFYECEMVEVENPDLKNLDVVAKSVLDQLRVLLVGEGEYVDDWYLTREVEGGVILSVVCEMETRIDTYYTK